MVFNKRKRSLEKTASIVGVVLSSILLCFFLYEIIFTCIYLIRYYNTYTMMMTIFMLLLCAICVCAIIFSAKLIKSPYKEGKVEKRTGIRVCAMIFAGLTGNIITLGLMIAVVCMKDFVDESSIYVQSTQAKVSYNGEVLNYNNTKRGLEKAAGIVGVIGNAITLCVCFYYIYAAYMIYVISGAFDLFIFMFPATIVTVLALIFSALIIKSPYKEGKVEKRTGTRVCAMIFAGLTGNIITLGLMIAVVCMKDFVDESSIYVESTQTASTKTTNNSIDSKITELKHLKEVGVIDDAQYEKAVNKIIEEIK